MFLVEITESLKLLGFKEKSFKDDGDKCVRNYEHGLPIRVNEEAHYHSHNEKDWVTHDIETVNSMAKVSVIRFFSTKTEQELFYWNKEEGFAGPGKNLKEEQKKKIFQVLQRGFLMEVLSGKNREIAKAISDIEEILSVE